MSGMLPIIGGCTTVAEATCSFSVAIHEDGIVNALYSLLSQFGFGPTTSFVFVDCTYQDICAMAAWEAHRRG